jgi:hypothetical protein
MLIFNKYFYKNKKSKLYFGDRVTVLNDFIYQTGGSTTQTLTHARTHAHSPVRTHIHKLEMAMGTRNPSTQRVLPDKETSIE